MLCRWCQVREDLLFAFEKCQETGLANPMNQALGDLLTRIRSGMPADRALDLMQKSIDHELLNDLVTAIRFNLRYRGDLPSLLEQMEWQMNKIEEEYVRRRLSNARDRRLTLLILVLVPLFLVCKLLADTSARQIFLGPGIGILLLAAGSLCYTAALAWFIMIQRKLID
jgi:Flp pilus assembly protein TadB